MCLTLIVRTRIRQKAFSTFPLKQLFSVANLSFAPAAELPAADVAPANHFVAIVSEAHHAAADVPVDHVAVPC